MQVALITPTQMLQTHGNMTLFHMILPDQLKTFSNNGYYTFYRHQAIGYKILDNGAAEGDQVHPVQLIELAQELQVNEVVVPDEMGNTRDTIQKAMEFDHVARRFPTRFKYMGVLQGRTLAQLEMCLEYYIRQPWISTIAFPRILQEYWHPLIRLEFIRNLERIIREAHKEIHCLGSTRYPQEVRQLAKLGYVRSIDTCVPAELARQGLVLDGDVQYEGRGQGFFEWTPSNTDLEWLCNKNYQNYLEWAEQSE